MFSDNPHHSKPKPKHEPGDFDVLFGRGRRSFRHQGNQMYRKMISDSIDDYVQASNKSIKTVIIQNIIKSITEKGGKFLKFSSSNGHYVLVSDKIAHEKTSQALRDAIYNKDKKLSDRDLEDFSENTSDIQLHSPSISINLRNDTEIDITLDVSGKINTNTSTERMVTKDSIGVNTTVSFLNKDELSSDFVKELQFHKPATSSDLHAYPQIQSNTIKFRSRSMDINSPNSSFDDKKQNNLKQYYNYFSNIAFESVGNPYLKRKYSKQSIQHLKQASLDSSNNTSDESTTITMTNKEKSDDLSPIIHRNGFMRELLPNESSKIEISLQQTSIIHFERASSPNESATKKIKDFPTQGDSNSTVIDIFHTSSVSSQKDKVDSVDQCIYHHHEVANDYKYQSTNSGYAGSGLSCNSLSKFSIPIFSSLNQVSRLVNEVNYDINKSNIIFERLYYLSKIYMNYDDDNPFEPNPL